ALSAHKRGHVQVARGGLVALRGWLDTRCDDTVADTGTESVVGRCDRSNRSEQAHHNEREQLPRWCLHHSILLTDVSGERPPTLGPLSPSCLREWPHRTAAAHGKPPRSLPLRAECRPPDVRLLLPPQSCDRVPDDHDLMHDHPTSP